MLCSSCSQTVCPVVAIDIDGTLGDYHGHFLRFASEYLGYRMPSDTRLYDGCESYITWFCATFMVDKRTFRDIKLAYRQGAQKRSMPAHRNAAELASKVREAGAELWITTTRPYLRHDGIDPDTREWLKRNLIEYDYLLYDDEKYERLADTVDRSRVAAVLDDLGPELYSAGEQFGHHTPIISRTIWNRAVNISYPRADSLLKALDMISTRLTHWYVEETK